MARRYRSATRPGSPGGRPPRRRGSRRLLGLLGLAAVGAGFVYLATRDLEPEGPELLPPPEPRDTDGEDGEAAAGGRWVEGPAGRLFVRTAGEGGPALLLVHGLGGSSVHWLPQLSALAGACRVVAPDLRGHGRSAEPAGGSYAIADHVADLVAVADALGLDRFALAGHSFGACVALELGSTHPERVIALALVDPGGDTSAEPTEAVEAAIAAVAEDPGGELAFHYREFLHGARPATARRVLADLEATAESALVTGYAEAMRYPIRARLAANAGPVLCLASPLNDTPGSLTRGTPGLEVEWLAPSSHWVMLDRPEQTSGLLGELTMAATAALRRS